MTHKTFVPRLPQSDLEYAILATKEFFQKAQNEHFFLTGCTSFFGKWLIESLLWANSLSSLNTTITVLSRAPELFLNAMPHLKDVKGLYFVKGDSCLVSVNLKQPQIIHNFYRICRMLRNFSRIHRICKWRYCCFF